METASDDAQQGWVAPFESDPRTHLAVALDVPTLQAATELIRRLSGAVGWFKVGAELFTVVGPEAIHVAKQHARVFLDTKYHDIPTTVARSVSAATRLGVDLMTVHAGGGRNMLRAAVEAAGEAAAAAGRPAPLIAAVTVLTSLGDTDLKEVGVAGSAADHVARLVDLALAAGVPAVVTSPREVALVRQRSAGKLRIVTPGVRGGAIGAAAPGDDQKRSATAADAIRAGSDLIVCGRPITQAADPASAAQELVREIGQAQSGIDA